MVPNVGLRGECLFGLFFVFLFGCFIVWWWWCAGVPVMAACSVGLGCGLDVCWCLSWRLRCEIIGGWIWTVGSGECVDAVTFFHLYSPLNSLIYLNTH